MGAKDTFLYASLIWWCSLLFNVFFSSFIVLLSQISFSTEIIVRVSFIFSLLAIFSSSSVHFYLFRCYRIIYSFRIETHCILQNIHSIGSGTWVESPKKSTKTRAGERKRINLNLIRFFVFCVLVTFFSTSRASRWWEKGIKYRFGTWISVSNIPTKNEYTYALVRSLVRSLLHTHNKWMKFL